MKILIFISQIYQLGGAERLAVELAEGLNRHPDVRADVLSMVPETFPGTEIQKVRMLQNGVPSIRFLGRMPQTGLSNFITSVRQLRKILVEENYDVIETSLHGPAILACWAVRGLRTRHIAGIHAIYQRSFYNSPIFQFWRWSCRVSDETHFYTISQEVYRHWIAYAHVKPKRVKVIYNSINNLFFHSESGRSEINRELNLNPNHRLLLFVGRLTLQKGLDTVIEGVKPLIAAGEASILLVGFPNVTLETGFGETDGFIEQLKQKLSSNIPTNTAHWLGKRDDVPRLMASADVLIHPARQEGFGLVLAEALATGLPVVATNVGGIPEVLEGTDSILVTPDRPDELRQAICKILNRTSDETNIARRRGLARANSFRQEHRTEAMLSYFRETMSRKA